MATRDQLYCQMLALGFIVLRQALDSCDPDWIEREIELLHNVPSLIGETNIERHEYFLKQERRHYEEWASARDREPQKSLMVIYYVPIWEQMDALPMT